jgi:hypothetical protein
MDHKETGTSPGHDKHSTSRAFPAGFAACATDGTPQAVSHPLEQLSRVSSEHAHRDLHAQLWEASCQIQNVRAVDGSSIFAESDVVSTGSTIDGVSDTTISNKNGIITSTGIHGVPTKAASNGVSSWSAPENIVTRPAVNNVRSRSTLKNVI